MDRDGLVELKARFIADYEELHRRLGEAVANLTPEELDRVPIAGANSIAVLVTHLLASELDWLGTAAGRSVTRNRDAEFEVRNREAAALASQVEACGRQVPELIDWAFDAGLETVRQHARTGRPVSVAYCLLHSIAHTAEHVGHVELTRQLVASGA